MGKHKHKCEDTKYPDIDLFKCSFLGKGHNGIVYLLPDNKVIKICFVMKDFYNEAYILKKVNGNKYFPRIYETGGNYMIRDYVDGLPLKKYIKINGLSRKLALDLITMLKEFERLKFKKIDVRCKDVFVEPDGKIKIIDPQKFYSKKRDFPRHLSKGLYKLNVLDIFMEVLKETEPKLYNKWHLKIKSYIQELKTREKL
ncbi:protein kinase [Clostridium sp. SYSU_GA19001]|uniref:protein kinase n=1 Tax=Clostridium caldaquaticum TaxID=2940653 RepID=UPI00207734CD|nr:protein kinase [Clostridium caldaquaticum]MCM8711400.1 protein kinase [Clostridium caldaquaticum]